MPPRVPQALLDELAADLCTIAVTGTNGKTTTTSMIASIAAAAGQLVVRVTTLGMWVGEEQTASDGSMASFVATLQRARERGARTLALEVTSRSLESGFATRWPAHVAVFTNLSQDHLDRHGTPERYLAAKAQLFVHLRDGGVAVLNADDPAAGLLREVLPAHARALHFGSASGRAHRQPLDAPPDLHTTGVQGDRLGSELRLADGALARALGHRLRVGTPGRFNVDNALAAALAAHAAGLPADAIAGGLASFAGVFGRFEILSRDPLCIVDFAHTPDGLERALQSTRALLAPNVGRVACVFGCGGERDQGKRAPMGAIADRLADAVWLTTDNPRGEDPAAIAAMVRAGAPGVASWRQEPERGAAVAAALAWAMPGDAVLVAGRGHERFQQLATGLRAGSDHDLVRDALSRLR